MYKIVILNGRMKTAIEFGDKATLHSVLEDAQSQMDFNKKRIGECMVDIQSQLRWIEELKKIVIQIHNYFAEN